MKTVVLVAPHFLPGFLPAVHRARLWAYYLEDFGWRPIILTTDPAYYECQILPEMLDLLPPGLEVIRTRAIPTRPVRVIGDIGLRSLWFYRQALRRLAWERRIQFVHFTVPAFTASLAGPGFYRDTGIPYGIDYIDPWVPETPQRTRLLSKHWLAHRLSHVLEPIAVRQARLITGINRAYFESVLRRNRHLVSRVETEGMPYGGSERDYEALERRPRSPFLFDPGDGCFHLIYAGALLPKAFVVADRLLAGIARFRGRSPSLAARVRVHFVGTGLYENDPTRGHTVRPFIEKHQLMDMVQELPSRISYLDVLNHLRQSAGVLVIGSTEAHYSPSKIYQSVMSRRPVFALLHRESTAVSTLQVSGAGRVMTFSESCLPATDNIADAFEAFLSLCAGYDANRVDWDGFRSVSARESSRLLASALDRALALEHRYLGAAP